MNETAGSLGSKVGGGVRSHNGAWGPLGLPGPSIIFVLVTQAGGVYYQEIYPQTYLSPTRFLLFQWNLEVFYQYS